MTKDWRQEEVLILIWMQDETFSAQLNLMPLCVAHSAKCCLNYET